MGDPLERAAFQATGPQPLTHPLEHRLLCGSIFITLRCLEALAAVNSNSCASVRLLSAQHGGDGLSDGDAPRFWRGAC